MPAKTFYLAKKNVDHNLGKTTFARPTSVFLALFTDVLDANGSLASEIAASNYARQPLSAAMQAASATSGTSTNVSAITFAAPSTYWGIVRSFGIMDASTGGNMLYFGLYDPPREVVSGGAAFVVPAGTIILQET